VEGGRVRVLGVIIQIGTIALAVSWTVRWLAWRRHGRGHRSLVVDVVLMWVVNIVFLLNPSISKLHLLWAIPACFVLAFPIAILFFRTRSE
ncbi:hypothetical protein JW848_07615, partial [Candidatus Bipolaricaulota bacterium]|nr:hypothetical protein [Candidatus Bipolaricaulota bacterium]